MMGQIIRTEAIGNALTRDEEMGAVRMMRRFIGGKKVLWLRYELKKGCSGAEVQWRWTCSSGSKR